MAVKDVIINAIPTGLDEMDEIEFKYAEGLRVKMAQSFGLTSADIINA